METRDRKKTRKQKKHRYPKGTCVGYKLISINRHEPTTIVWDTTGIPHKNPLFNSPKGYNKQPCPLYMGQG